MITKLARQVFSRRLRQIDNYDTKAEDLQMQVLRRLVCAARTTEWGRAHGLSDIHTYEQFSVAMPVATYEEHKTLIDRMRHGEPDVLCAGRVRWYAKSSGTTNDKSKFLPVSATGLRDTHYAGGTDCVALYLATHPNSRILDLDSRALILGGSHASNYNLPGSLVGDLSAILIENINPLVNMIRVPQKSTALLADFEQKRERIAHEALTKNVTNISGVPSWMMSVLTRMMEISGKTHLEEVWPNLEVFFHGGVAFTPYRDQYHRLITKSDMTYMETYNASEGFFGIQNDQNDASMLLMIDYGIFYEFIPMSEFGRTDATPVPLWGVEKGRNYAMVITTSSGLWRYVIGDTVMFTSVNPYKIKITGRTKSFINAFGEELIVDNAEQGLKAACAATNAQIRDYTAAPMFMDENARCRHQWLVDFAVMPNDTDRFVETLDHTLQTVNSDYEAKRFHDITLQRLELIVARPGLFDEWLKLKGKLGGQHKVPRLANDRSHIDELLMMNTL